MPALQPTQSAADAHGTHFDENELEAELDAAEQEDAMNATAAIEPTATSAAFAADVDAPAPSAAPSAAEAKPVVLNRSLFVRNIAYDVAGGEVRAMLETFGPILRFTDLIKNRGIVFVTYVSLAQAPSIAFDLPPPLTLRSSTSATPTALVTNATTASF
jgi:hypothetical protein